MQQLSSEQLADLGSRHIQRLLTLAQKQHQNRKVEKPLHAIDIQRDILKSLAALEEFLHLVGPQSHCHIHTCQTLIEQCLYIKDWISRIGASKAYLQFLSPGSNGSEDSLRQYQVQRVKSPLPQLLACAPDCAVWRALLPEIDKQIWVVR